MYKDTITLFNRHEDTWRATVLHNVDLNADRAALIAKYGADSKDKASLHIQYAPGPTIEDFSVVEPKAYTGEVGTITFRPASSGEVVDFFMEGVWDGDAVIDDSEYDTGFFDYLSAVLDGVYAITSVARYSVIPHYEILGR